MILRSSGLIRSQRSALRRKFCWAVGGSESNRWRMFGIGGGRRDGPDCGPLDRGGWACTEAQTEAKIDTAAIIFTNLAFRPTGYFHPKQSIHPDRRQRHNLGDRFLPPHLERSQEISAALGDAWRLPSLSPGSRQQMLRRTSAS